jgi:UDP-2,3-diacylglucosamine pyrophosphatase LpxH
MRQIFISDLHIGDGSAKDDFEFDDELIDLLEHFSTQPDVELIIVGDGLELLESRAVKDFGLTSFDVLVSSLDGTALSGIESRHPRLFKVSGSSQNTTGSSTSWETTTTICSRIRG